MMIKVLNDTALVIGVAETSSPSALAAVRALARNLAQFEGLDHQEIVPGLTAVAVHLRPEADVVATLERLESHVRKLGKVRSTESSNERERIIPVVYGSDYGPDLMRVADHTGLSVEGVIERHLSGVYQVMALGFAPGFPYLSGMDPALACPRLDTPRLRVPAGAVGIGGAQTGVYPQELPGGWNIIGRTFQRLFDPEAAEPAWLRVGDRVRFSRTDAPAVEISADSSVPSKGSASSAETVDGIEVESGGVQTTVQDLGRVGYQSIGVADGGALDQRALSMANLMVGNAAGTPALEWVLKGPILRFHSPAWAALAGAEVEGHLTRAPFQIARGEVLDLSRPVRGGRGYLAVGGGIAVPLQLGSASTHLGAGFGGFGGRALRSGDRLPVGLSRVQAVTGGWQMSASFRPPPTGTVSDIRILPGPEREALHAPMWQRFMASEYVISADSNRMGFRLQGPAVELAEPIEMISQPVSLGTVQLPPSGQPLVLMADRQSVGGYPRIASVISADIPILAQVPLGGSVRFVEVSLAEAQAARWEARRELGLLAIGLHGRFTLKR